MHEKLVHMNLHMTELSLEWILRGGAKCYPSVCTQHSAWSGSQRARGTAESRAHTDISVNAGRLYGADTPRNRGVEEAVRLGV